MDDRQTRTLRLFARSKYVADSGGRDGETGRTLRELRAMGLVVLVDQVKTPVSLLVSEERDVWLVTRAGMKAIEMIDPWEERT
jgi:hypothetical protein